MFPVLKNDRCIRALLRQDVDVTPVWIMRQAGRYLPEYKETRARAGDFMTLCKTPELACEVTLQPVNRYPLDAAILFSDILTVPDAMGLGLSVVENTGPVFEKTVRTEAEISALKVPDPADDLGYVTEAVSLIRRELDGRVPLIGFAGSPWTLSVYMVEGGSSKYFHNVKGLLYTEPRALHTLLGKLADAVALYLNAQIEAGAQAVMIFDTWGGILTHGKYKEFSLAYMRQIIGQLRREYEGQTIPVILFTKGAGLWMGSIADSGCDAVGVDWSGNIGDVRKQIGARVALQGNMDPAALYAGPEGIQNEVADILESYGHGNGHVFNLGHGIQQYVDPEHVGVFVDAVHELSRPYHDKDAVVQVGEG